MNYYSIVIPTFNDENIIKKKIILLNKKLKKLAVKYEIIIINDGSTDKTYSELLKISRKYKLVLINNKINRGKSYSIIKEPLVL